MKTLLFLLFPVALIANPCDGNPRIAGNVTMTCQETPLLLAGGSFLQVHVQSANTITVDVFVDINWRTSTDAGHILKTLRMVALPLDRSVTIKLPVGATVEYVQVEENIRNSSAGFVQ